MCLLFQQKYNKTVQVQVNIIPRQPGKELSVTARESFFQKSWTFGLGQAFWAENFWGIKGIFSLTISTYFGTVVWVPCPCFPLFNRYFYKKTKPLYPTSKYLFGNGIWLWATNNLRFSLCVFVFRALNYQNSLDTKFQTNQRANPSHTQSFTIQFIFLKVILYVYHHKKERDTYLNIQKCFQANSICSSKIVEVYTIFVETEARVSTVTSCLFE